MLGELTPFEIQLREQILSNWKNYNPKRFDLGIAREKQQFDIAGKYICVEGISDPAVEVSVILNDKDNGALDLVDGVEIKTLFKKVFITNAAQGGQWIDIIFGADFEYKKTGQGTGGGAAPSTIKKAWSAQTQIVGAGDAFITLAGTTESFSAGVDLEANGYEGSHVITEIEYDATPVDQVKIKLYGSLDGTNYDDTPIWEMMGDMTIDPQQLSFIIKDLAHYRIGFQQTGATDSHDVRAYVKNWNFATV